MPHRYTQAQHNFIVCNYRGRTTYELLEMFNHVFKSNLTRGQLRGYLKNHNITSGLDRKEISRQFRKRKYTEEQIEFIRTIAKGTSRSDITKLFNDRFDLDVSEKQVMGIMSNYKITNGLDCRIKKGNIPPNKGKKGMPSHPNAIATQFKKGEKPRNWMPVGSERVNSDGYVDIKIAEPNKWRGKHLIVWEEHNGAIPQGYVVIFGDRNRFNFDIDNLILVSKRQLLIMNHNRLIYNDTELTKTGLMVAKLHERIKNTEHQLKENQR